MASLPLPDLQDGALVLGRLTDALPIEIGKGPNRRFQMYLDTFYRIHLEWMFEN